MFAHPARYLQLLPYRRFKFQKSCQLFISVNNEALSVAAMCVGNPDYSSAGTHGCNTAPTPSGFAEIVSYDFPILHAAIVRRLFSTGQRQKDNHGLQLRMAIHAYKVRPRKDKRGVDLISDALPFGRLLYGEPNAISNAINHVKFYSRSHDAVIRVFDDAGNVIETHEHKGDFKEP